MLGEERLETETKREQAAAALLISGLQQRLLSSIEAFARTLRVHRKTMERHWAAAGAESEKTSEREGEVQLDLISVGVDSDDDRATLSEGELEAEEDAQIEAASPSEHGRNQDGNCPRATTARRDVSDRRKRTGADRMPASKSFWSGFGKTSARGSLPRGRLQPGHPLSGMRLAFIIFTEYDDTKRYVVQQLTDAIAATDRANQRIAVYHGPTPQAEREEIKRAFNTDPKRNAAAHPRGDGCGSRGSEPPDPLLEPLPPRRSLESEPDGAAKRTHRPQAPAERRGLLPLLRLPTARRRPDSSSLGSEDRDHQARTRKSLAGPRRSPRGHAQPGYPTP